MDDQTLLTFYFKDGDSYCTIGQRCASFCYIKFLWTTIHCSSLVALARNQRVKVKAIKVTCRILRNWKVLKRSFLLSKRDGGTSISMKIFNQFARKMLHYVSLLLPGFVSLRLQYRFAIHKSFLVLHIPNKYRAVSMNGIARLHVTDQNERSFRWSFPSFDRRCVRLNAIHVPLFEKDVPQD